MAKRVSANVLQDETNALAESVAFMAEKLREAHELLQDEPLVVGYDNGGGQSGMRINPHYTAYEKLLSAYNKSLGQLYNILKDNPGKREQSSVLKDLNAFASKRVG